MNSNSVKYINPRTLSKWSVDNPIWCAPDDGGYVNLTPGTGLTKDEILPDKSGLWRYRSAIRVESVTEITLGEGWTPLVSTQWKGSIVLMKCEYLMPSGSFKDRGTVVLFNYLKQIGVSGVLEDSSGNAGSSYATYAAAMGLNCRIMLPSSVPESKKIQIASMGAQVEEIVGTREDVAKAARSAAEDVFYGSHNWQPFFIEGTKTLAFEIWEQLGFEVPDNIIVPLGYGSNVLGLFYGFKELQRAGEIKQLPRIFGAQAANCAPFYWAWQANDVFVKLVSKPTIADGIASEKPVRVSEVLGSVRKTNGEIIAVKEQDIIQAFGDLSKAGFFIEPTGATAAAAFDRLMIGGTILPDQVSVVVLTGHGLKAADKINTLVLPYLDIDNNS